MEFNDALFHIKNGKKLRRSTWGNMFISLFNDEHNNQVICAQIPPIVNPWLSSSAALLADDWEIVK